VRHAFSVPLWLSTTDKTVMRDMVGLQLERRGFGSGGQNAVWDFEVIAQEDGRSLVGVTVLPPTLPEELQWASARGFDLSARCLPLPSDGLVLWEELGRLVLAVTRGGFVVYAQVLVAAKIDHAAAFEIQLILLDLELQGLAKTTQSPLQVWKACDPEELDLLRTIHPGGVHPAKRPVPRLPLATKNLVPPSVTTARRVETQQASRTRILWIGLAIYLVGALVWGGQIGYLAWQRSRLQKEIRTNHSLVENLQKTSDRWKALESAVTPETYAAELLLQCSLSLPSEGVRLTTFGIENNRVIIVGEGRNATAPYDYEKTIKANAGLQSYRWNSAPPKQLPSGTWQFTLEGVRNTAGGSK
jgi:hypothetical protein